MFMVELRNITKIWKVGSQVNAVLPPDLCGCGENFGVVLGESRSVCDDIAATSQGLLAATSHISLPTDSSSARFLSSKILERVRRMGAQYHRVSGLRRFCSQKRRYWSASSKSGLSRNASVKFAQASE